MSQALADLPARLPVWLALSDLYLDTEVAAFHPHIVRTLAASPYALDELEYILLHEVHPLLRRNLAGVSGEWAGFDPDWLVASILRRLERPRWWRALSDGWLRGMVRAEWDALRPRIAAARAAAPPL
ncbi:DUF7079 family protein [Pseudoxanthomonas suwonensis]|uniref:DUF7079 domain-containing protein n=1 Tax=Pseudoxanthomonas suwonensis TaxID=314722 RepID=A0A0E3UNB6_9GAMM|nr:hypothetical protein [Pseudoxanthomonas suwonensis]AKC86815.1 hypothetical protein WQ53_08645 [Pseudoxanthomonas suwonensis]